MFSILVLTDYSAHTDQNSMYALTSEMATHPACKVLHVASRNHPANEHFFNACSSTKVMAHSIDGQFNFTNAEKYRQQLKEQDATTYDVILLRIPRPVADEFFLFLENTCRNAIFINRPSGILKTSNKGYLMTFSKLCAPMQLCHTIEDVEDFARHQDIVLKPLEEPAKVRLAKPSFDQ